MHTGIPAEIDFSVGHFRKFRTSVTLTLTLDGVKRHTVMYHSSHRPLPTCQISFKSEKNCGRTVTDGRTSRPVLYYVQRKWLFGQELSFWKFYYVPKIGHFKRSTGYWKT